VKATQEDQFGHRSDLSTLATEDAGVSGNARLTGMTGAVIFVLLAAEGFTIVRVGEHLTAHVFIGMMLVPLILLKTGSTSYRILRYYRGDRPYVRKGPPHLVLRILGPLVVLLSIAVVGTGIAAIESGHGTRWLALHKATFIAWFVVMTIHVLGHIIETTHLAVADLTRRHPVTGASTRVIVTIAALIAGIALAISTRGLAHSWHHDFARF
jgi:hypothetical protein